MTQIFDHIKMSRTSLHVLFWVAWVIAFTYIKSIGHGMAVYLDWLNYYILTLPVFVIHTYLIAYWLIPQFVVRKRYLLFLIIFLVFLFGFSIIELILSNDFIFKYLSIEVQPETAYLDIKNVIISGIGNHYIIILFLSIKVLKSWYNAENEKNELQIETIESEIQLLKNQLHPKFLLNVINILEKMAIENSDKTPDMIIRVSNLMNSIMLDQTDDKISLSKELNLIESFVDIMKIVRGTDIYSQVIRSGDIESRKIPALFFFPLVDQAMKLFKSSDVGNDFRVLAKNEDNYLLFLTSFYHYGSDPYVELQSEYNKLKKRLDYYYENKYNLNYSYEKGYTELTVEIFQE